MNKEHFQTHLGTCFKCADSTTKLSYHECNYLD